MSENIKIPEALKEQCIITNNVAIWNLGLKNWSLCGAIKNHNTLCEIARIKEWCMDDMIIHILTDSSNGRSILDTIYNDIITDSILKDKQTFIIESKLNFDDKRYLSCVSLLFPLIEFLLEDENNKNSSLIRDYWKRYKHFYSELLMFENIDNLITSFNLFFENFTMDVNFDDEEPCYINRHWLAHGRTKREITEKDCLQLYCGIKTLLEVRNNTKQIEERIGRSMVEIEKQKIADIVFFLEKIGFKQKGLASDKIILESPTIKKLECIKIIRNRYETILQFLFKRSFGIVAPTDSVLKELNLFEDKMWAKENKEKSYIEINISEVEFASYIYDFLEEYFKIM